MNNTDYFELKFRTFGQRSVMLLYLQYKPIEVSCSFNINMLTVLTISNASFGRLFIDKKK